MVVLIYVLFSLKCVLVVINCNIDDVSLLSQYLDPCVSICLLQLVEFVESQGFGSTDILFRFRYYL